MSLIGPATAFAEGRAAQFTETRAAQRNGNGLKLTESKIIVAYGVGDGQDSGEADFLRDTTLAYDFNNVAWNGAKSITWSSGNIGQGTQLIINGAAISNDYESSLTGTKVGCLKPFPNSAVTVYCIRSLIRTVDATFLYNGLYDGSTVPPLKNHKFFTFREWFAGAFPTPYEIPIPASPLILNGNAAIRHCIYATPNEFDKANIGQGFVMQGAP